MQLKFVQHFKVRELSSVVRVPLLYTLHIASCAKLCLPASVTSVHGCDSIHSLFLWFSLRMNSQQMKLGVLIITHSRLLGRLWHNISLLFRKNNCCVYRVVAPLTSSDLKENRAVLRNNVHYYYICSNTSLWNYTLRWILSNKASIWHIMF
jgi:hypothetical protein